MPIKTPKHGGLRNGNGARFVLYRDAKGRKRTAFVTAIQDGPLGGVGVTTQGAGGTLTAATYGYRVTAVVGGIESVVSAEVTVVVSSGTTNQNTISWQLRPNATAYKVYGRTAGSELLLTTLGVVNSFIDTGSLTPSGAMPANNGAANLQIGPPGLQQLTNVLRATSKTQTGVYHNRS